MLTALATPGAGQWAGDVSVIGRRYLADGDPGAHSVEADVSTRVRRVFSWADGTQFLTVALAGRFDPDRTWRSRVDATDLAWEVVNERWELVVGAKVVNWGVAESVSIVDVVNQLDLGDDRAIPVRLGQPMLNARIFALPGRLDLYLLPWFRERDLEHRAGALWSPIPVRGTRSSSRGVDGALRWSHIVGAVDLAVAHFSGTSREPRFLAAASADGPGFEALYEEIDQTSVDAQWTHGDWLVRVEVLHRWAPSDDHVAAVTGLEFAPTTYLSFFTEYVYDGRGGLTATSMERDAFFGIRLLTQDWTLSSRTFVDLQSGNVIASGALSRRMGDGLSMELDARLFAGSADREPRLAYRLDDYLALRLSYFF